ncbi:MAG: hypothetical protein K0M45_02220 [Candidatus Paracaedibacteraceae bacterium]|nr:hypothetical protein [Candidatus Paracaedibacteraceae bacterium]
MKNFICLLMLVYMGMSNSGQTSEGVSIQQGQSRDSSQGPIVVKQDGLNFVMEKLTGNNLKFWQAYRSAMFRVGATHGKTPQIRQDYIQALKGFQNAIDAFKNGEGEVWIAYATHNSSTDGYNKMAQIEICMTVTTSPDVPIVTHMGIFKTPLRGLSPETIQNAATIEQFQDYGIVKILNQVAEIGSLPSKPNLSLSLHKFAAQIILHLYPDKEVMITAPLKVMETFLKGTFGEEAKTISLEKIAESSATTEEKFHYILKSEESIFMKLPDDIFTRAPWLDRVTFLLAQNPKIAINLHTIASFGEGSSVSPSGDDQ